MVHGLQRSPQGERILSFALLSQYAPAELTSECRYPHAKPDENPIKTRWNPITIGQHRGCIPFESGLAAKESYWKSVEVVGDLVTARG
jgi:hypothetical protein